MTKVIAEIAKEVTSRNGGNGSEKPAPAAVIKPAGSEAPVAPPAAEPKKELTVTEKILKIENLQLLVSKRQKLIETYSQLERFQIGSNDFNCSMRLNDSDGNVFNTSFTPGIKKVIDFLKVSFEKSIEEVEDQINF